MAHARSPTISFADLPWRWLLIPEGRFAHIFREAHHLADTPANRNLLQSVADDPGTALGADKFLGNWSARTLDDGTQAWTQTRKGDIVN